MKLIVTVGMPGSGKDELIAVAQSMGLATLKMGDLVREETRRRGLALSNANVARIASEERDKHGAGIWAQRALPKLTGLVDVPSQNCTVIDLVKPVGRLTATGSPAGR